jgi:ureidoglycolate lyase
MAGVEFLMRHIECQAISAEAFTQFGVLVDANGTAPEMINDGSTARYADLASLDLGAAAGDPKIGIYVASARNFPLRIAKLERHRQASQVFIPLGMQRFIVVVAPGDDEPDWLQLAAFLTEPGQGISVGRGCWHHGLIALGDADRFAVIEGAGYRLDTEEVAAPQEIWLDGAAQATDCRRR